MKMIRMKAVEQCELELMSQKMFSLRMKKNDEFMSTWYQWDGVHQQVYD